MRKKRNANDRDLPGFELTPAPKKSRTADCPYPLEGVPAGVVSHVEYYLAHYSGKSRSPLSLSGRNLCSDLVLLKPERTETIAEMLGFPVKVLLSKCKLWSNGTKPQKPWITWVLDVVSTYPLVPQDLIEACAIVREDVKRNSIASHKRVPILQVHRDVATMMVDAVHSTSGLNHTLCALNVYEYFSKLVDWELVGHTLTADGFQHGYMSIRKSISKRGDEPSKAKPAQHMSKEMLAIFDAAYKMHCLSPTALHSIIRHGYINHTEVLHAIEWSVNTEREITQVSKERHSDKRIAELESRVEALTAIVNLRNK